MNSAFRRFLTLLLAALILSANVATRAAVEYDFPGNDQTPRKYLDPGALRIIEALPEGKLNAICAESSDVYLLEQNVLWRADDDLNRLEQLHQFDESLCGFCVSDGRFYFSYVEDDRTVFARLTDDGQTQRLFDTTAERPMFKMLVAEENVIVMWLYSGHKNQIHWTQGHYNSCKIDVYTLDGELRIEDLCADMTDMIYRPKYGLILLPDLEKLWSDELTVTPPTWNIRTGAFGELTGFHFGSKKLAVTPDGNAFYSCDAGYSDGICRSGRGPYAIQKQQAGPCMDPGWYDAALACTRTRLYCYRLRGDMNLHSMELPSNAAEADSRQITLTIAHPLDDSIAAEPVMQAAQECFRQIHPDVRIRFEPFELSQLKTALMAGDDVIDLLSVNMYEMSTLAEMGALCDLNEDAELRQRMEQWTGNRAFCWKGLRYGVPVRLDTSCLFPNRRLSGFALDVDWQRCTWLEWLQKAEQFHTDTNDDGVQDVWLLADTVDSPQWLFQYAATFDDIRDVRFDAEAFRALAEQYKRCFKKGVLIDWNDAMQQPDTVVYTIGRISDLDRTDYLPQPAIAGERTVPAYTYSLALSKSTAQYDLALDFLRCFTSDAVQSQSPFIGLAADTAIYPEYARLQNPLKQQVEAQKEYVDRGVAQWRNNDYHIFQAEQFEKYLNDRISLDELVDSLQQKLRMVIWG